MDKKRILAYVDTLEQDLKELRQHIQVTYKEYAANIEKRRFTERTLQLLIESCVDICQLLVRELRLGLPTEEESLFMKLQLKGILSVETTEKLKEMKKFRNVLIHKYVDIDDSLVYHHAREELGDFEEFKKEILLFLKKTK